MYALCKVVVTSQQTKHSRNARVAPVANPFSLRLRGGGPDEEPSPVNLVHTYTSNLTAIIKYDRYKFSE
jgi:hypothetical protein